MENGRNNTEKGTVWEVHSNLEKKMIREHYGEWDVYLQISTSKTKKYRWQKSQYGLSIKRSDSELTGITGIWGDRKQMSDCEDSRLYALWTTMPNHHLTILVIQTSLLSLNIARSHSFCLSAFAPVLCFFYFKGLPYHLWVVNQIPLFHRDMYFSLFYLPLHAITTTASGTK